MAGQVETPRLMLRQFEERDASSLLKYLSQPITNCFTSDKIIFIEEALTKIHKRKIDDDYIAVCLKDSDQLMGEIFFIKKEPDTDSIGWNFNGKGYAKESHFLKFISFIRNEDSTPKYEDTMQYAIIKRE